MKSKGCERRRRADPRRIVPWSGSGARGTNDPPRRRHRPPTFHIRLTFYYLPTFKAYVSPTSNTLLKVYLPISLYIKFLNNNRAI